MKHDQLWQTAWADSLGGKDLTNARTGGRASKANPNKEDQTWWQDQGPRWVAEYISWREANPDWKIWITPDGVPAVELVLAPTIANGTVVKMVIDRIFEVQGSLVVVDLKTSSRDPSSALQLGFYKWGVEQKYPGMKVAWGTYFMSRKAGVLPLEDLSFYTDEKMEYLINGFDVARKTKIYIPNPSSCNLCGFTKICQFTTKGK